MKLSEIRKAYEDLSGKLSDVNRQLAFAGIGIIWIFKISEDNNSTSIPNELFTPLLALIISLGIDLLQYLIQTFTWYFYYLYKQSQGNSEEQEINEPEYFNYLPWLFLLFKVVALITAYVYMFEYLRRQLFH